MNNSKYLISILIVLVFASCSYEFPVTEEPSIHDLGTITVDKIIAVGDGYMAGVMDGALYSAGQKNSLPAIIANQIKKIKEIEFVQPDVVSENGYNFYESDENNIYGKWFYQFTGKTEEAPHLLLTQGEEVNAFSGDKSKLNNFAIPNLRIGQLNSQELAPDPYYNRIASSPESSTLLLDVVGSSPSFVIVWLGMDHVLGNAVKGAPEDDSNVGTEIQVNLPSIESFRSDLDQLMVNLLQGSDCKIVVGNLISVQDLPFFYHRVYNSIFLKKEELINAFARYREFNKAVTLYNRSVSKELQRPYVDFFDNGHNLHPQAFVVIDNSLPDATYPNGEPLEKYRSLAKNELVFYNITDKMIGDGYGSIVPLEGKDYLSEQEIERIKNRVEIFNSIILEKANNQPERISTVDINHHIRLIAETGRTDAFGDLINKDVPSFNGIPIEGALGLNSIFSLDGLHFNQRGNAYIANLFIESINQNFGADIPNVDINNYLGNVYTFSY